MFQESQETARKFWEIRSLAAKAACPANRGHARMRQVMLCVLAVAGLTCTVTIEPRKRLGDGRGFVAVNPCHQVPV